MVLFPVLLLLETALQALALVPVTEQMSTFGVAIKGKACDCSAAAPPDPTTLPNVSQYFLGA